MNGVVVTTPPQHRVLVTASHPGHAVISTPTQPVDVTIPVGKPGPKGPPGNDAQWAAMTLEEYNALTPKDPNTLYVILE